MPATLDRAVPAPSFSDAPLRAASGRRPNQEIRIEAARQLRMSLWLVAVTAIALCAVLASRPDVPTPPMGVKVKPPIASIDKGLAPLRLAGERPVTVLR